MSWSKRHCLWFIWMLFRNTINAFKLPSASPICRNCSINEKLLEMIGIMLISRRRIGSRPCFLPGSGFHNRNLEFRDLCREMGPDPKSQLGGEFHRIFLQDWIFTEMGMTRNPGRNEFAGPHRIFLRNYFNGEVKFGDDLCKWGFFRRKSDVGRSNRRYFR